MKKGTKGITLIALVITIIVLLILVGITIATLTGENGILMKTDKAKKEMAEKEALEEVQLEIAGSFDNQGNYQSSLAKTNLETNLKAKVTDKGNGELKVEYKEYTFKIDINGNVNIQNVVNVEDIFDNTGKIEGKLHIGDFINYTAGNWTKEDMDKIKNTGAKKEANNSTSLPTNGYEFGGFTEGSSRDGNATPYSSSYNYAQVTRSDDTKQEITGWRLFDVAENGAMTLISAGCPEDYYHCSYGMKAGYISEYILTGNVNDKAKGEEETLKLGTNYTPRDWNMYVNSYYGAVTATVLTKTKLDEWYSKYQKTVDTNTHTDSIFQSVYGTKYESLIDNYSYYWLSNACNLPDGIDCMSPRWSWYSRWPFWSIGSCIWDTYFSFSIARCSIIRKK